MTEQPRMRVADIATRAGITPTTWTAYVTRGRAPKPDGHYDGRTPWWWTSTINAWLANRPGQGARTDLHAKGAPEGAPDD